MATAAAAAAAVVVVDGAEVEATAQGGGSMTQEEREALWRRLLHVRGRVRAAAASGGSGGGGGELRERQVPRLVAVSKTKPAEMIEALLQGFPSGTGEGEAGQLRFGENYVQELVEKAAALPPEVEWHFIGHLQSNKAAQLVRGVPNLVMVETVDTEKIANRLNAAVEANAEARGGAPLGVYVQVHTSTESSKAGVTPEDAPALARHIASNCPFLRLAGLMTIGAPGDMSCFDTLVDCRTQVAGALEIEPDTLELSMGMSADFEEAIRRGSTNVRVGSTIFGARAPKIAAS